jgi:hypothetical protein
VPESVAFTVKAVVPKTVGVPVICPPVERLSPGGRVVLFVSVHVYGGVPPLAPRVTEYGWPCIPLGTLAVVITKAVGCTVNVVLPVTEPCFAEIVEFPPAIPDASPELLIVATLGCDDDQVTRDVMFCVLPSL